MRHAASMPGRVVCMALALATLVVPARAENDRANAIRDAARRVCASVVTIETVGGTQPIERAAGTPAFVVADGPTTGLVWSADGLIVTSSFNFVRQPSVITVVLSDGRRLVAELLARDEIRRLAMLRIDAKDLPVPVWARAGELEVGQQAVSLGRGHGAPAGVMAESAGGCTVTAGIVSGLRRMSGLALQTDAKLSPANFGGPLIDLQGRVMGLCVPIGMDNGQLSGVEWYDSGIGFAVPRDQVEISAAELAGGHNIRRGLLGVLVHPTRTDAVIVIGMGEPSPARRAGVEVGDEIVSIDSARVGSLAALKRVLRPRSAGTSVTVHLKHKGKDLALPVVLAVSDDIGPMPPTASLPEHEPRPATLPSQIPENPLTPPSSGPS